MRKIIFYCPDCDRKFGVRSTSYKVYKNGGKIICPYCGSDKPHKS